MTEIKSQRYIKLKSEFNKYRNFLRKTIVAAKRQYYFKYFNMHRTNLKKTWDLINKTINSNCSHENPCRFSLNDEYITDKNDIANAFNNFFVNIGQNMARNISSQNISFNSYLTGNITSRLHFQSVTELDLISIIKELKDKKSSGHDGISTKTVKIDIRNKE